MKNNSIKLLLLLGVVSLTLTGCLKDSLYDSGATQSVRSTGDQNYIEVHLTTLDNTNIITYSYNATNNDTTVNFVPVHLTSANPATEDVNVTFQVVTDTTGNSVYAGLVTNGAAVATAKLTIMNANNTVTIPKGSNTGYIQVKFVPNDFPGSWVIAFKLTGVSSSKYTISNLDEGYVQFGSKNKYDGIYQLTGTTLRAGDATRTGAIPTYQMSLITSGANAVTFGTLQDWADGSQVGIGSPVLAIDPTTDLVTITSSAGAYNNPGYTSKYNPDKKAFYISFTWGAGVAARLATDTLTYIGPR